MEAIVLAVAGKLCEVLAEEALKTVTSLFAKEVSLLAAVHESMTTISQEFEVMNAFIRQADAQKGKNNTLEDKNNPFEVWLEQVRKVAFHAEDIIDEYSYIVGEQSITGVRESFRRKFRKPRNIRAWHGIATELKQIEAKIKRLADVRGRWNINLTGGVNYTGERTLFRADSTCSIDDEEIVGIGEEKARLVAWLTSERLSDSIISVWGMGGSGKTTLATNVYRSQIIKKHFTSHAWVTVSQTFTIEDLLRRILIEFFGKEQATTLGVDSMNRRNLVEAIRSFLQGNKYLLILYGVQMHGSAV